MTEMESSVFSVCECSGLHAAMHSGWKIILGRENGRKISESQNGYK